MTLYTEGTRTVKVKKVTNLSPAEVRLFFYFLIQKRAYLSDKKAEEFQKYLESGELPQEIGFITKKKRKAICIRKMYKNYYTLYMSVNEDTCFNNRIRKILEKVKK